MYTVNKIVKLYSFYIKSYRPKLEENPLCDRKKKQEMTRMTSKANTKFYRFSTVRLMEDPNVLY